MIERALHGRYGDYFRSTTPSRLAFFVFAKQPIESKVEATADRVSANTAPLPT